MNLFVEYQRSMRSRILTGISSALGISIFISSIIFEHSSIFFLFSTELIIIPILIFIVFGILIFLRLVPPLKTWLWLSIFMLLIFLSYTFTSIRAESLKNQREEIAEIALPRFPESERLGKLYGPGDGTTNGPYVLFETYAGTDFANIRNFYDEELQKEGWQQEWSLDENDRKTWSKGSNRISITNEGEDSRGWTKFYEIMDF